MLIYANHFFPSGHLPEARGWPLNEGPTVVAKNELARFLVNSSTEEPRNSQYRLFFNIVASVKIQKRLEHVWLLVRLVYSTFNCLHCGLLLPNS